MTDKIIQRSHLRLKKDGQIMFFMCLRFNFMICKEITLRIRLIDRLIYIEEIIEIDISQLEWIIIIQEGFSLFLDVLLVHESKV
jgi:hypothetical protein